MEAGAANAPNTAIGEFTIFEGFGIPIIEAMYSKTPVITNKYGVFPEAGGPDSLYIDPNDPDELAEKINLLLLDSTLRNSISDKGYEFAQQFNDEQIFQKFEQLYSETVKS